MTKHETWEVCVVGGGPAGAVAALELRRLGFSVTLVHHDRRLEFGPQTLSPAAETLFTLLGLGPVLSSAAVGLVSRKRLRWHVGQDDLFAAEPRHLLVDRRSLDEGLRRAAGAAGAACVEAMAGRPVLQPGGSWWVPLRDRGGPGIAAKFLVVAGGRRGLGGRSRIVGRRQVALYFRGQAGEEAGVMTVGRDGDRWFWSVGGGDGTFHLLRFMPPAIWREAQERGQGFDMSPHPAGVADATARSALEAAGTSWIRVGDALFSPDPLSSSGLYSAALSAQQAARVINTIARRPGDTDAALQFYAGTHVAMALHHRQALDAFEADGDLDRPAAEAVGPVELSALSNLVLSPRVRFRPIPSLQGDFIAPRPGLVIGDERLGSSISGIPVDFLLAPFLEGGSAAHAVERWQALGAAGCSSVLRLLVGKKILIPRVEAGVPA